MKEANHIILMAVYNCLFIISLPGGNLRRYNLSTICKERAVAMTFLNFALGETAEMLGEAVREFAQREIAPRAAEIDASNHFPAELWPKLGQLGLLGITVEEEYGGSGLGYLEHAI